MDFRRWIQIIFIAFFGQKCSLRFLYFWVKIFIAFNQYLSEKISLMRWIGLNWIVTLK